MPISACIGENHERAAGRPVVYDSNVEKRPQPKLGNYPLDDSSAVTGSEARSLNDATSADLLRPPRRWLIFVGTFRGSFHPEGIIPSSHAPHKIVVERRRRAQAGETKYPRLE